MKKKTVTLKYHRQSMGYFKAAQEQLREQHKKSFDLKTALDQKNKEFADLYTDYRNEKLRRMQAEEARTRLNNKLDKTLEKEIQLEQTRYELEAAVKQLSRLLQENLVKTNLTLNKSGCDSKKAVEIEPYVLPIIA